MRRLLLLGLIAALVQGCSAVRLGYGSADSLVRWRIDQYVDLSPAQDAMARERLARLLAWHRKTQLADYVALTRQGQKFIDADPTAAEGLVMGDELVRRVRHLAEQAIPDVADFLPHLTPVQIERMAKRFAEKDAEHAREIRLAENEAEQRKARVKRVVERSEYWFGDMAEGQVAAVRRIVEAQTPGTRFWYEERLRRQREWLALVRQVQSRNPPRERIIELLRDYVARFDLPKDPLRLARARGLRRDSAELAAAIVAMATPEQRAHARHKLDDLARDFVALARDGTAPDDVAVGN